MNDTTKKCPACGEEIKLEARICRFCNARFEVAARGYCQIERKVVEVKDGKCTQCGNDVLDAHVESKWIEGPVEPTQPTPARQPETVERLKRPGCVTAYAIYLILGAALFTLWGFSGSGAVLGYDASLGAILTLIFLTGAILNVAMAIGLWQLRNWARILVLVFAGLGIATSSLSLISVFLFPTGSSATYLPSSYYTGKAMSLIVGLGGLFVNSTVFDWFKKNGRYFTLPAAPIGAPKPMATPPVPAPVPVQAATPDAPSAGFRLATPEQQIGNINRIKQWCALHKDESIKVVVISIFDGREDSVTSAHGKLLAIEEHPSKQGVFRMQFDSHVRGSDYDAVMLGYEVSSVEEKGNRLVIYKSTQQRFELIAGDEIVTPIPPPEPQIYLADPTETTVGKIGAWNYGIVILLVVGLMAGIGILLWLGGRGQASFVPPTGADTALDRQIHEFAQPILDDVHNRQPNFEDDFSDLNGRFDRWRDLPTGVTFLQGIMRINTTGHDGIDAGGSMNSDDFVLEFTFAPRTASKGSAIVLNFGWNDSGGYNFDLNILDNRWRVLALPKGRNANTIIEGWCEEVGMDRKTHVIAIVKDGRFAFYVNGNPLSYVEDESLNGGWVGLGVWSPSGPTEVDFDNVKFWDLNSLNP